MSTLYSASMDFDIGTQVIALVVTFHYVRGSPATGPSYASGGEPADPPEVDIRTIVWSRKPGKWPAKGHFEWHPVEFGPLFSLIAEDEYVYGECCDAAEDARAEQRTPAHG